MSHFATAVSQKIVKIAMFGDRKIGRKTNK